MPDEYKPQEPTNNIVTNLDIDLLKAEVGQRFPFYDFRFNIDTARFLCRIDENLLDENFESLRKSLSSKGYIPMIRQEYGEQVIYVIKKPKGKKRSIWINILLFIATVFTTMLAGSVLWVEIENVEVIEMFSLYYIWNGFVFFSVPLLLILGVHEMGHYYASKKHHVEASLPYFIPLPPPFTLGTFGALISTREPIPNRKALIDIGAAGPICGFLVSIPIALIGLYLMQQNPIIQPPSPDTVNIMFPFILQFLSSFFTIPANAAVHPTAFAAWVGLFVTAINLLPVGQLDGGHVVRGLFKEKSKYVTWFVIAIIIILGFFSTSWLIFAIFIVLLIGTHHPAPLNDMQKLDSKSKLIGLFTLIIFILCFAPVPFS